MEPLASNPLQEVSYGCKKKDLYLVYKLYSMLLSSYAYSASLATYVFAAYLAWMRLLLEVSSSLPGKNIPSAPETSSILTLEVLQ